MKKIAVFLTLLLVTSALPQNSAPYRNKKLIVEKRVEDLIKRMTLEEKIDLLGGTGFGTKPNERLGIPELKMSDGPLGVRWDKSTSFAGGIGAAATWDTALIARLGSAIGRELKAHGRNVILGPCVNIARVPVGGRNFESFGEDPYLASRIGISYIKGVQEENVAATIKHFAVNNQEPNRGFVNVKVDERALNEIYLPAFKSAVAEAHPLAVMTAYNKLNGPYCSENEYLLKTKLINEWKFDGLIMSDWGAVHSSVPTAIGGLDLEMPTGEYLNSKTLSTAIKDGTISQQTIDDKVKRILTVIFKLGLFDKEQKEDPALINSSENRKTNLQLAREGIVLLKNNSNLLPLNENKLKSLAVIGPNAAFARTGGGGSSEVTPLYSVSPLKAIQEKLGDKVKINYAPGVILNGSSALPVETESLFLPDSSGHGLLGEYYSNEKFEGTPDFTRTDSVIDFKWETTSPKDGFSQQHFSVRWTGFLTFPKTGRYSLNFLVDDGIRLYINDKLVINEWSDHAATILSYESSFEADIKYKIKIEYYQGVGGALAKLFRKTADDELQRQAVEAAKNSDAAILFVGTTDDHETEGRDRKDLALPEKQDELIKKVLNANKNTVIVITSGSPVLMDEWNNKANSVLETWFAGSEIGNAIADVVFGKFNPSGKLPVTFAKRWEDYSCYSSYNPKDSVIEYPDGILVGYRYFDAKNISPLYCFGHGLSYTKFDYDNLAVTPHNKKNYKVTFTLRNSGDYAGAEVAQLYISAKNSKINRAPKELKAFNRTELKKGEVREITINLDRNVFAYYNAEKHEWCVEPGKYEIMVGSSSSDIRLKKTLEIK